MIEGNYQYIQVVCPKCGNNIIESNLLLYPPIKKVKCVNPACDFEVRLHPILKTVEYQIPEDRMKTMTGMMQVIKAYGKVLNDFGVKDPVFLMTRECKKAIMNPDGMEFEEENWRPIYDLPENLKNMPGVQGMYCGVLLKEIPSEKGRYETTE